MLKATSSWVPHSLVLLVFFTQSVNCDHMRKMNETKKWACDYCTYENFPAAKKCTLCRASRTPQIITDDTFNSEQDIYKMASMMSSSTNSSTPTIINTSPTQIDVEGSSSRKSPTFVAPWTDKWACHLCTYLNWPRAVKCTQCLSPRKQSPTSASVCNPSVHQVQGQPLCINTDDQGGNNVAKRNSPNSPETAKDFYNDKNRAVSSVFTRSLGKWTCKACTFDNWPKSLKCVICGANKPIHEGSTSCHNTPIVSSSLEISDSLKSSTNTTTSHSSIYIHKNEPLDPQQQVGATAALPFTPNEQDNRTEERRLRLLRKRLRDKDWSWLNACIGVVEGDSDAVETYLASGGNPARQMTQDEVTLLKRPSAFEVGYTLVHLAIRFQREDLLAVLLTATDMASKVVKRLPSHSSPDLATDIRREISTYLRQRKGDFPCYFFTEYATFALPNDIDDLPRHIHSKLFDELLDKNVQSELEVEESIINWSLELTDRLSSRLYALWNRTAGDCLLDSVLQATWGVFDVDNSLRRALAESLSDGAMMFYPRWKEYESMQAQSLHFTLDESQWQHDWAVLLSLASQPGASLEQMHIFALAHILRRPIIVYGVKYVKSFRGETIGYARFQGVYLPLLWERSFCWKTPITLGYTRGHFSALVPMEPDTDVMIGAGANIDSNEDDQIIYLPLIDSEGKLLPVHFLSRSEIGREESIIREWLDCCVTKGGVLVALQKLGKRPLLVKQMVDEWLDHYRQLSQHMVATSHQASISSSAPTFSSDGESDEE